MTAEETSICAPVGVGVYAAVAMRARQSVKRRHLVMTNHASIREMWRKNLPNVEFMNPLRWLKSGEKIPNDAVLIVDESCIHHYSKIVRRLSETANREVIFVNLPLPDRRFDPTAATEEQLLSIDRAVNAQKPLPGWHSLTDHHDLEQQNRGES